MNSDKPANADDRVELRHCERRNAETDFRRAEREFARLQQEYQEDANLRQNEVLRKLQGDVLREVQTFATSAGFGKMDNNPNHVNLDQQTYDKGYYESGLLFNNLLRHWFIGYGLGVYYRYGPYTLDKTIDNFAFKFTINFKI